MSPALTRRQALKLIAASTTAAALSPALHARARYPVPAGRREEGIWRLMGRAIYTVAFYEEPSISSERLDTRYRDQSFPITSEVHAPFSAHNDLWYETPLGYVHSAWVLPVRVYPPQPFIREIGEWGFWGQVSQVYTEARVEPHPEARKVYRFYGGTVYHVIEAFQDEQGTGWYKVFDEFPGQQPPYQWVLAKDVRRVPRAEMAPIHPFAGEKRVEIDLSEQELACYEGDRLVFTTPTASGMGLKEIDEDTVADMRTPEGDHCVILKQPSRHMSNRPQKPNDPAPPTEIFDLPGVPWNTFFDLNGVAVHGTYWHNDFGIPRSHGCVNVSIEAARWIHRWAYPIGGYEDDFIQSDCRVGTPIIVF